MTSRVLARRSLTGANAMPSVVLAAEHCNMIARMLAAGVPQAATRAARIPRPPVPATAPR
jgi:hypothetical protein